MTITAKFTLYEEKVHSVRYNEAGESKDQTLRAAYVSKLVLDKPFPRVLYITITDVEASGV